MGCERPSDEVDGEVPMQMTVTDAADQPGGPASAVPTLYEISVEGRGGGFPSLRRRVRCAVNWRFDPARQTRPIRG